MKKVLVFGTFDIFHEGHKDFLRQAKKHGDYLRVVIARDKTVKKMKKIISLNQENERRKMVEESGLADEVVLGNLGDKYEVIRNYRPDVICLGYDQEFFIGRLSEELIRIGLEKTEIIRLNPYKEDIFKSKLLRMNSGT